MLQAGGQGGIRTHETVARLPVFKTGAFNRSATCPHAVLVTRIVTGGKMSYRCAIGNGQIVPKTLSGA